MTLREAVNKGLELVLKERKVAAFLTAVGVLGVGFCVAAYRSNYETQRAYETLSEWVVYLAGAFFVGNAATYFGSKKGKTQDGQ